MKKNSILLSAIVIAFVILMSTNLLSAQVVNTESFEGNTYPPAGWSMNTAVGGQGQFTNAIWARRNVGSFPATATAHTGTWMSRYSAHFVNDPSTQALITPVIDYSGITANDTAYFSFWVYRDNTSAAGDSLTAFVNTIADVTGATRLGAVAQAINIALPDTQSATGWYQYTFQVPNSFNTNTNFLMLQGTGHTGNNIFTDDWEWTSYPPQCSSTPTIGILSSSTSLICGGSGTAVLTLTGQSSGESGLVTVWQSSSSATGPWTDVSNTPDTYTTDTLSSTTYFRAFIACSNTSTADTSVVITVNVSTAPLPVLNTVPTGNTTYCNGSSGVICSVSGATNYIWSPAAGLDNSTGDLVIATPTANTTYTILGSDTSGCSATATLVITVGNGPNVNPTASATTVCTGSSVNLNSGGGGGGGNQYSWEPGGLTGNNVTVNPTTTTTYTLTATGGFNGCSTVDSSIVIVVTQDVTANFGYTQIGNTILFHDSSTNASSWQWTFGDGNGSTNESPVYTYSGSGAYTVTLIVTSAGCPGGDTIQIQVLVGVGIDEISNSNHIIVYPNPVTDNLININFNASDAISSLSIVNALGEIVLSKDYFSQKSKTITDNFNLKNLASGIYQLQVKSGDKISSVRFVK